MEPISATGIVLLAAAVGEADRRLVLLTREQGRVTVFARGASRPRSPLVAASRPFVTGTFRLYPRRDSYSLHSVQVQNYFVSLTEDFDKMAYGCYFLELAAYFSAEEKEEKELLNLLYLTLRAMEKGVIPLPLVRLIYEYRLFVAAGEYPQVFTCPKCGRKLTEGSFSASSGEAVCPDCLPDSRGLYLPPSAMYTLQYILTQPLTRIYSFLVTKEIFLVLRELLDLWKKKLLNRAFRSEELIRETDALAAWPGQAREQT